jgi:hypothetical protein
MNLRNVMEHLGSEKSRLNPDVKMANDIVCDHVRDKLDPYFCNLLYIVYKESPICSWAQPWDVNLLSCCQPD